QGALDAVEHRADESLGELGPLELRLHDVAQLGPGERVGLQRRGARRVAGTVDALERRRQELVLFGVGQELDLVDGGHRRRMVSSGCPRAPGYPPTGGLSRTVSIRVVKLSDGVEWGVHACTVLSVLPADAALPAPKLAEYHGVPSAYLAKHLQALERAGGLENEKGRR